MTTPLPAPRDPPCRDCPDQPLGPPSSPLAHCSGSGLEQSSQAGHSPLRRPGEGLSPAAPGRGEPMDSCPHQPVSGSLQGQPALGDWQGLLWSLVLPPLHTSPRLPPVVSGSPSAQPPSQLLGRLPAEGEANFASASQSCVGISVGSQLVFDVEGKEGETFWPPG